MRVAWIQQGATLAAALTIFTGAPLKAADDAGVHYVADELGDRTKTPEALRGASKGLSDSAVRVMSTYALSILPDYVPDANGKMVKPDKSDPSKYLIPLDDARRVIRVATRSAYAEVCQLLDLEKANFDAMIRSERTHAWTHDQMMFIHALHTFATAYFAGNFVGKITDADTADKGAKPKEGAAAANAANAANGAATTTITAKKLECPPGQKEKVAQAITAYVQSAPPPTAAATPHADSIVSAPLAQPAAIPAAVPQAEPTAGPAAAVPQVEPDPAPVAGGAN